MTQPHLDSPVSAPRGDLAPIIELLQQRRRILVTSHSSPDGDAIGATLGLGLVLEKMGHDVVCFNEDPVPEIYHFLPTSERLVQEVPLQENFDLTFIVDVFDLERAGLAAVDLSKLGTLIVLDHHLTDRDHGDMQFIDPTAAATGVLVYRLAKQAGVELNFDIGLNIFCCIATDTGSFRYSSATPEAFQIAAETVALGVKPWEFSKAVYESHPARRFQLLSEALKTLEVTADGRIAAVHLDYPTMQRFQANADLTDGFINFPRAIAGVEVAIFFRQNADGTYKASMRSSGQADVSQICKQMGGGGHRNAAGCTLQGNFSEAKAQVFDAIKDVLKPTTEN